MLQLDEEKIKHPKCKGFRTIDIGWGSDYDCGYNTSISCDDCKYGNGTKNPEKYRVYKRNK